MAAEPPSLNGGEEEQIHSSAKSSPESNNAFFTPGTSQWTDVLPHTTHVDLFRNCDFGTLGPLKDWGPALRMYTSMLFTDSRGACIYWGPGKVAFYNEQFSLQLGVMYSSIMGKGFHEAWGALGDQFGDAFDQAARTACAFDVADIPIFINRDGFEEETYYNIQFIPLRGDSGEIEGFYNTAHDGTQRVLQERRQRVVDRIVAMTSQPDVEETTTQFINALEDNPKDITMAMLYSYDEFATPDGADLRLRGSIGVPHGHRSAPVEANLATSAVGMVPYFRQVHETGRPLVLSQTDGSLQATNGLFDGITWAGFGEPSRDVVILPLVSNGTKLGFYVQGTNPRRLYDRPSEMHLIDVARQLEIKWVASISAEQAQTREQNLERRATDSEDRLKHMAQHVPFGMCQITPDEKIEWANQQFYDITGHSRSKPNVKDFHAEVIGMEEIDAARRAMVDLLAGQMHPWNEFRLRRPWKPPVRDEEDQEEYYTWILTMSSPVVKDGKVEQLLGYVVDISHQKWAESVQTRNAMSAAAAKRRQEEFIDSTSHEMRNPLTAMTQLADGIAQSLPDAELHPSREEYRAIVEENVDAANTILACAAHQKRVIDDVLILSRLESRMLSITPVPERPSKLVSDTIKMFSAEVSMNGSTIEAVRDPSYDDFGIDYVMMDTSRLTQILINLISNAIKFTGQSKKRKISVVYGAQSVRPPRLRTIFGGMDWLPTLEPEPHNKGLSDLREGEDRMYLYFCVQDTGTGMSEEEMQRLFKRFSQGSSKTHIAYGGSGIGLYICRQLAEKQGGGIGVAAKSGEGAVFAFYIETRPATEPELPVEQRQQYESHAAKSPIMVSGRPGLPQRISSSPNSSKSTPQPRAKTQPKTPRPATPPSGAPSAVKRNFQILLVEDNLVNQRVLAKQLRKAGCTVLIANHGAEALEVLKTTDCWRHTREEHEAPIPVQVILLDWEMPVMNGLECCKRIRELERTGEITKRMPVIAITANVRQEQMDQALAAGMDNVMTKPFTSRELLERIEQTIDASGRLKSELAAS